MPEGSEDTGRAEVTGTNFIRDWQLGWASLVG